jgi:hypothetical protein
MEVGMLALVNRVIKVVMIVTIIFGTGALTYFVLGVTAVFQRGIDLAETAYLIAAGIPLVIATITIIMLLTKSEDISSVGKVALCVIAICVALWCASILIINTPMAGWITEKAYSSLEQITDDGKYEYQFDLINFGQRNVKTQIRLIDMITKEEKHIPIDVNAGQITFFSYNFDDAWIDLKPSGISGIYIMKVLQRQILKSSPSEFFEIDIEAGTARPLRTPLSPE